MSERHDPFHEPAAPLPPGRTVLREIELAHFRNLLQHRTNPDGTAKKGYARNVEQLRREIALLEATTATAPVTYAIATETLPEPIHV